MVPIPKLPLGHLADPISGAAHTRLREGVGWSWCARWGEARGVGRGRL